MRIKLRHKGTIRDFISFGSNDYPALPADERVCNAAINSINKYGIGSTGSGTSTGQSDEHRLLNELLEDLFDKESSLLFNSGYIVNATIFSALARPGDLLLYDQLCHASIQDGVNFAVSKGVKAISFKHNDPIDLERILQEKRGSYNDVLLISEGIFSIDGNICKIREIVARARKYNCRTFLDSAHDIGVLGPTGLGAAELFDCLEEIDVLMGTFSKCGGSVGGFIFGSNALTQFL